MGYNSRYNHVTHNNMSIEGGFNKRPAPKVEVANDNFTPTPELLNGLKGSLQLGEEASERDVADAYLNSLAHSKTEFGKDQGSPIDLLPVGMNENDFEEWAKRSAQG
jgi:hypothetical protein